MPTELDHDAIKEQIATILSNNTNLFDANGVAGKLNKITVGVPDGDTGLDSEIPSAYITNSNPLERVTLAGSTTRSSEDVAPLLHTFRYKIVFGVNAEDSRNAEEQLDDFQKLILETLEADQQLKNGGSAVVDTSRPESVELFRNELNGKSVQGRIITYLLTRVTS